MDIFNFNAEEFLSFLLTLARISIVLFLFPIFDSRSVPRTVKGALCLLLSLALWPVVALSGISMPAHPFDLLLLVIGEVILGLVLALAVNCFFAGIQSGGEILAMQMGFSMIQFADPVSGRTTGLVANFLYMITSLLFLAFNGHLMLIHAFAYTFQALPAGELFLSTDLMNDMIKLVSTVFIFAVRLAAPVMVVLMMAEAALGLMNRAAPQIHVMEVGFPLKISVGFFLIGMLFVILAEEVSIYITGIDGLFYNLISLMRPQE